ncbi:hypothetical protein V2J94_28470 [Streptomyces sp. DSM 41524]|uniref:Uncharacterized protein n=1 Tax=Streptomyces asiaticus subsp. ignotus TaxID=3098222 RepID=A0ABU7Q538_9ACTN|nr:hypothetical protein [Streptomyces sp. DSM 41524]
MPEGGEGQQPNPEEHDKNYQQQIAEAAQHWGEDSDTKAHGRAAEHGRKPKRLPIESLMFTPEARSENLVPYVLGELRHKEDIQGKLEDRERRGYRRTPEGNLYRDFYDVGVDFSNAFVEKYRTDIRDPRDLAVRQDIMTTAAAYALLTYSRTTPDLEQPEAINTLWPILRDRAELPGPGLFGVPELHLTEQQADLLSVVTQRVGIDYDKSQTVISTREVFRAWGQGNWDPASPSES